MKMRSFKTFAVCVLLSTTSALAQEKAPTPEVQQPTGDSWTDAPARPAAPAPAPAESRPQQPAQPAQPSKFAPPASVESNAVAPAQAPDGQWVYTQQYGWVWLPHAREYTYVGPEGYPYSYVYYPSYGWSWLYSPWVFGWGPSPYWGVSGRAHFGWYTHPWHSGPRMQGGPVYRGYGGGGYLGGHSGGYRGGYHGGGMRGGGMRGGGRGHR